MVRHTERNSDFYTWYDGGDWCGPYKIWCAKGPNPYISVSMLLRNSWVSCKWHGMCAQFFGIRADFSVTVNSAGEMKTVDTWSPQTCNTGRGLSCEAVRSNSSGAVCCRWDVAWSTTQVQVCIPTFSLNSAYCCGRTHNMFLLFRHGLPFIWFTFELYGSLPA